MYLYVYYDFMYKINQESKYDMFWGHIEYYTPCNTEHAVYFLYSFVKRVNYIYNLQNIVQTCYIYKYILKTVYISDCIYSVIPNNERLHSVTIVNFSNVWIKQVHDLNMAI